MTEPIIEAATPLCISQEQAYTQGWIDAMCGVVRLSAVGWTDHYSMGQRDADRRLKCPAMYAGYYDRRESP